MLIKTLRDVTIARERKLITDVRWGRVSDRTGQNLPQKGIITGIWKLGCALTTRHNVREGENIWIRAKDDLGRVVISLIGTVTWSENVFRLDGYRVEVRFRDAFQT